MAVQRAGITSKSRKKIFLVCLKMFFSEIPYQLGERKKNFNFLTNPLYCFILRLVGEI